MINTYWKNDGKRKGGEVLREFRMRKYCDQGKGEKTPSGGLRTVVQKRGTTRPDKGKRDGDRNGGSYSKKNPQKRGRESDREGETKVFG